MIKRRELKCMSSPGSLLSCLSDCADQEGVKRVISKLELVLPKRFHREKALVQALEQHGALVHERSSFETWDATLEKGRYRFVIARDEKDMYGVFDGPSKCLTVLPDWIEDCVRMKELINPLFYAVELTKVQLEQHKDRYRRRKKRDAKRKLGETLLPIEARKRKTRKRS